jgi:hypothetical protein
MKKVSLKITMVALLIGGMMPLTSCTSDVDLSSGVLAGMVSVDNEGTTLISTDNLKTGVAGTLTTEQADWLKFMREEEKVARDLYLAFGQLYTSNVFIKIPKAEDTHMSAIVTLMTAYGIEDVVSAESGVFNNPDLQALYTTLYEQGKASLVEALKVGALVEETDIQDLADVYALTPPADLITVAEALMLGSRNHLRAFNRTLVANGVTYTPSVLDQAAFDAIIASPMEKGSGLGTCISNGQGKKYMDGNGNGKGSKGKGKGNRGGK